MVRVIIDTSIFAQILKKASRARKLFYRISGIVPAYLIYEIRKKKEKISQFTRLPEENVLIVLDVLLELVEVIPEIDYLNKLAEAYEIAKEFDPKDTPFIALALKLGVPIWTEDKKLIKYGFKSGKYLALDTRAIEELLKGRELGEVLEGLKKRI